MGNAKKGSVPFSRIKEFLRYEPDTGHFYWRKAPPRGGVKANARAGGVGDKGYRRLTFALKVYPEHRLAWYFSTGKMPTKWIDHINGDPSDNRICNLREATVSENGCNRGAAQKHLPKGVWFFRSRGCYRAEIKKNGIRHHLGYFSDPSDAAAAYREAATRLHGEFARFE